MAADNPTTADESLDVITDALLTASRLLVAISARSIGLVDETITIPQFRTLVILANRGPINLATLAGLLGVQPSATGRMVDRLVAAGLIDRLPHPTSRRELLAALTRRGRDADPARRRCRPPPQAGALPGGPRSPRPGNSVAAPGAAQFAGVRRGTVGVGPAVLRRGGLWRAAARRPAGRAPAGLGQPALLAAARVARRGTCSGRDRRRGRHHRGDHLPNRAEPGLRTGLRGRHRDDPPGRHRGRSA